MMINSKEHKQRLRELQIASRTSMLNKYISNEITQEEFESYMNRFRLEELD